MLSRTVLIPLGDPRQDEAGLAEQAINCMEMLTDPSGSRVLLFSAIDHESSRDEREAYLDHIAGTIGGSVETVVEIGDPSTKILEIAASVDNPIIVMASHGRRGAQLRILGSVAASVAHGAKCPVLILPASSFTQAPVCNLIERVLLPITDALTAEDAVRAFIGEVGAERAMGVDIHLVAVSPPTQAHTVGSESRPPAETDDDPALVLRQIAETKQAEGYQVTWDVRAGNPAKEIGRLAGERAVNMTVMLAHDQRGFNPLALDILAAQVRTAEPVPVFLVQPVANARSFVQSMAQYAGVQSTQERTDR